MMASRSIIIYQKYILHPKSYLKNKMRKNYIAVSVSFIFFLSHPIRKRKKIRSKNVTIHNPNKKKKKKKKKRKINYIVTFCVGFGV